VLGEILESQCGVVTRAQALACGMTVEAIRARVRSGRWQTLFRSVYATYSGPIPRESLRWAAVLRAGERGALSHQTAAELIGLLDEPGPLIHVTVPSDRRIAPIPGVALHYSQRLDEARHPLRLPAQTRAEETVVDLTQASASLEQALGWIARACGRRITRPERIASVIDGRKKIRWREDLLAGLDDVAGGAQSSLELRYLREVERAHGLPAGSRQRMVHRRGGRSYDDVRYAEYGVAVELDGRAAHPDEARWRDMRRDNAAATSGRRVLRYGWADVTTSPCEVAAQVATVLCGGGGEERGAVEAPGQQRPRLGEPVGAQ